MSRNVMWLAAALLALAAAPAAAQNPQVVATPEQPHVTLGEAPGTLVLHFAVVGQDFVASESPVIQYRIEGGDLQSAAAAKVGVVVPGGSNTINQNSQVSTHVYAATVGPIPAGANVTYRGGGAQRGFTSEHTVRMVPAEDQTLRFVAYGDIGVDAVAADGQRDPADADYPAFDIRDLVAQENPDLVIIPGDLAYTNTRDGWDRFMRFMHPVQSKIIYMPATGNHEWDNSGGQGYGMFLAEYVLPNDEQNFVFRAGPVTFIAVNSDNICGNHYRSRYGSPAQPCDDGANGSPNQAILDFLKAALEEAATDSTPWTVVYHHHPAYSWGRHGNDWGLLTLWEPLYVEYGVDVVVAAHDHLYSRSFPVALRKPLVTEGAEYPKGLAPVHVVTGGGGRALYDIPHGQAPAWHAMGAEVHHYTRWTVTNDTLSYEAVARNGTVFDSFRISSMGLGPGGTGSEGGDVPAVEAAILLVALAVLALVRRRSGPAI